MFVTQKEKAALIKTSFDTAAQNVTLDYLAEISSLMGKHSHNCTEVQKKPTDHKER